MVKLVKKEPLFVFNILLLSVAGWIIWDIILSAENFGVAAGGIVALLGCCVLFANQILNTAKQYHNPIRNIKLDDLYTKLDNAKSVTLSDGSEEYEISNHNINKGFGCFRLWYWYGPIKTRGFTDREIEKGDLVEIAVDGDDFERYRVV